MGRAWQSRNGCGQATGDVASEFDDAGGPAAPDRPALSRALRWCVQSEDGRSGLAAWGSRVCAGLRSM
jgi:hypothetical protein